MVDTAPDFTAILELLMRHQVEFMVVGGVCAVLLGAPVATFDLDIFHSRSNENLERLSKALQELEAHYRDHLPDQIEPKLAGLANTGHHLLTTKFGPLDVMGSIGVDDDYIALEDHIERVSISEGLTIRILNLDTLITVKQKTARSKDNYMLEILRAMKERF
ncbi:MAG: nucleotidyltransferase [Proteobacteria bacterium]|nr:nucleotidyltransferase [Pseudomonadota bacterium]